MQAALATGECTVAGTAPWTGRVPTMYAVPPEARLFPLLRTLSADTWQVSGACGARPGQAGLELPRLPRPLAACFETPGSAAAFKPQKCMWGAGPSGVRGHPWKILEALELKVSYRDQSCFPLARSDAP